VRKEEPGCAGSKTKGGRKSWQITIKGKARPNRKREKRKTITGQTRKSTVGERMGGGGQRRGGEKSAQNSNFLMRVEGRKRLQIRGASDCDGNKI